MKDSQLTRGLLAGGAAGCVLFVVIFLIAGGLRADYDALRYPVSSLSIGDLGWIQVTNFIVTGLLILGFALGLRRALAPLVGATWGPLLIGLAGMGLIGAGVFTTDPIYGYPPDAPLLLVQETLAGRLHNLFSALVFLGLPIACFVFTRRFFSLGKRRWAVYSVLSGLGILVFLVLSSVGFSQTPGFVDSAGLYQRLSIITGWTWMALLARHVRSTSISSSH